MYGHIPTRTQESEVRAQKIQIQNMEMQIQEHDGRNAGLSQEDASTSSRLVCQVHVILLLLLPSLCSNASALHLGVERHSHQTLVIQAFILRCLLLSVVFAKKVFSRDICSSCDHRVSLCTHEQFQDSNFASRFAKEMLGNSQKQKAWASFKTTARLWAGAFTQETSVGFVLTGIHSLLVGEFFIPYKCWTSNFSTSIVEAHYGKGLITAGEMKQLINIAYLINVFARHIEPRKSTPGLSRSDAQWRNTDEWDTYNDMMRQFKKKNKLQIGG